MNNALGFKIRLKNAILYNPQYIEIINCGTYEIKNDRINFKVEFKAKVFMNRGSHAYIDDLPWPASAVEPIRLIYFNRKLKREIQMNTQVGEASLASNSGDFDWNFGLINIIINGSYKFSKIINIPVKAKPRKSSVRKIKNKSNHRCRVSQRSR